MAIDRTQADPDVWIKRAIKNNGTPYYKMMLIYVDDILTLAEDPKEDMTKLSKLYNSDSLKVESIILQSILDY